MSLVFNRYYKKVLKEYVETFNKEEAIKNLTSFLGQPLKPYAKNFVEAGLKYGVDPYLTAAIASLETGHGTAPVFTQHKNVSGKWDSKAGRHATYSNVVDSIYDQARFLRENYINKGLNTIEQIGAKYAPVGAKNDPNGTNASWPSNVSKLYAQAAGGKSTGDLLAGGSSGAGNLLTGSPWYPYPYYKSPAAAIEGLGQGLKTLSKAIRGGM